MAVMTRTKEWFGLSTDTKPDVAKGSTFVEMDTGAQFVYDGSSWRPLGMAIVRQSKTVQTATIASGAATSDAVDARGAAGGGYILPSTFDGTALTFTVCDTDDGTFMTLYDQYGSPLSVTVAASRAYPLPQELFAWPYFKLVSGTNQSTTDTLIPVVLAG